MEMNVEPGMLWRKLLLATALLPVLAASAACHASDADPGGAAWDAARARLIAQSQGPMAQAVSRWEMLSASDRFGFGDYAGFILSYRGFPEEAKLRRAAEAALDRQSADASSVAAFFDRVPPLTNPARAQYALALKALGRPDADAQARAAWRGGPMSEAAETAILSLWGGTFTADDEDARMDALLWAGNPSPAARQTARVSPARRGLFAARLATLLGVGVLLVSASSVFAEVQAALNAIWRAPPPARAPWLQLLIDKVVHVVFVLGIGVFLLFSLLMSAVLSALARWAADWVPESTLVLRQATFGLTFLLTTLLFALVYKLLPNQRLRWRDVLIGATATALLFTAGKSLIGWYIGTTGIASGYGAAGSLMAVLLWIYYSAQIFLLGAEFTRAWVDRLEA